MRLTTIALALALSIPTAVGPLALMSMAGVSMPLESYPLQALVSEPVKPCFPCVVMSNAVHACANCTSSAW